VVVVGLGIGLVILNQVPEPPIDDPIDNPDDAQNDEYTFNTNATYLKQFERNVQAGGPPPDGIPPIEDPVYWDVEEADEFLNDADIVFGLVYNDLVIAYPQRILVWHEIVNENFDGTQISITYCPLTGSAVGFNGHLPGNNTTFGTSGRLVNSNLVMYDRATNSYFPQILSTAINKNYEGLQLERIHLVFTNWARWKFTFPDTLVLSTNTGFVRDYTWDPYGDYTDTNSYYHNNDIFFPVMNEDDRLFEKTVVIGIDNYQGQYAIQKQVLKIDKFAYFDIGNVSYVALYDSGLDTVRTFERTYEGVLLNFTYAEGYFTDHTGTQWFVNGSSDAGSLTEIANMDVMWFAWAAYFPNTGLTCLNCV
jgi:hypothetical protein